MLLGTLSGWKPSTTYTFCRSLYIPKRVHFGNGLLQLSKHYLFSWIYHPAVWEEGLSNNFKFPSTLCNAKRYTLLHWPVCHTGHEARWQWMTDLGLDSGSHWFSSPVHDTARVLTPTPQLTEHWKNNKRTISLRVELTYWQFSDIAIYLTPFSYIPLRTRSKIAARNGLWLSFSVAFTSPTAFNDTPFHSSWTGHWALWKGTKIRWFTLKGIMHVFLKKISTWSSTKICLQEHNVF